MYCKRINSINIVLKRMTELRQNIEIACYDTTSLFTTKKPTGVPSTNICYLELEHKYVIRAMVSYDIR